MKKLQYLDSPVWEVTLHENNLGLESGKYMRVKSRQNIDRSRLAERIACSLRNVSPAMAEAVLAEAEEQIVALLSEGCSVSGELGRLSPAVSGVWDADRQSPTARAKATGKVNFSPTANVRDYFARVLLREDIRKSIPELFGYTVMPDGKWNAPVSVGGILFLQGRLLRMQAEDEEQGVVFHRVDTGEEVVRIPADRLPLVQNNRVMVQLPEELTEGAYTVTLINRRSNSSRPTKQLRKAVMNVPLLVSARTYDL